jgi:hypothetical protein
MAMKVSTFVTVTNVMNHAANDDNIAQRLNTLKRWDAVSPSTNLPHSKAFGGVAQ